jgi:hypothetical protein
LTNNIHHISRCAADETTAAASPPPSGITVKEDTMTGGDSLALRDHLENLPQELYDVIKELTFTLDTVTRFDKTLSKDIDFIRIDEFYRPPAQLHINSKTRNRFRKLFYRTTFVFASLQTLSRWLRSLSVESMDMLKDVRCVDVLLNERGFSFAAYMARCYRERKVEGKLALRTGAGGRMSLKWAAFENKVSLPAIIIL